MYLDKRIIVKTYLDERVQKKYTFGKIDFLCTGFAELDGMNGFHLTHADAHALINRPFALYRRLDEQMAYECGSL